MIFFYFLIIFGENIFQLANGRNISAQMEKSLQSLEKALNFLDVWKSKLNLDGLVGVRFAEDMLGQVLKHEPEVFESSLQRVEEIRNKMKKISDEGMEFVEQTEPKYAATLGKGMGELEYPWYPSISTDPAYLEEPIACEYSYFNETISDKCLTELVNDCNITSDCIKWELTQNMREYRINHQLLFWQMSERLGCVEKLPTELRVYFCTNILRDAKRIAKAGYPTDHQDLFMEQIGFCGPWGFYEFYDPEWVDNILSWQYPEGCLKHSGYPWHCIDENGHETIARVKREEREMEDGCMSHKTGTWLGSIAASLRYQAEMVHSDTQNRN